MQTSVNVEIWTCHMLNVCYWFQFKRKHSRAFKRFRVVFVSTSASLFIIGERLKVFGLLCDSQSRTEVQQHTTQCMATVSSNLKHDKSDASMPTELAWFVQSWSEVLGNVLHIPALIVTKRLWAGRGLNRLNVCMHLWLNLKDLTRDVR